MKADGTGRHRAAAPAADRRGSSGAIDAGTVHCSRPHQRSSSTTTALAPVAPARSQVPPARRARYQSQDSGSQDSDHCLLRAPSGRAGVPPQQALVAQLSSRLAEPALPSPRQRRCVADALTNSDRGRCCACSSSPPIGYRQRRGEHTERSKRTAEHRPAVLRTPQQGGRLGTRQAAERRTPGAGETPAGAGRCGAEAGPNSLVPDQPRCPRLTVGSRERLELREKP